MKFYSIALSALLVGAFASCSNDVENVDNSLPTDEVVELTFAKAPEFVAWSGAETYGTRAGETTETTDDHAQYIASHYNQEVEVNLSIQDLHSDVDGAEEGLENFISKLSLHVRSARNFTVTLPIPAIYLVPQDDLFILQNHESGNYKYNVEDGVVEYRINGQTVTLTCEIGDDETTISISGLDDNLIKYCADNNGDGVNFEIYNYFNNEALEDALIDDITDKKVALKRMLDESTITFKSIPKYYINAFGYEDYKANPRVANPYDCFVTPTDVETHFNDLGWYYHLNGTPFNHIYVRKGASFDEIVEDAHSQEGRNPFETPAE